MTRIGNVQEFEFPEPSVAVHVTVLVPIGKTDPFVGDLVSWGAVSPLSETGGRENVREAPPKPGGASATIRFPGQPMTGGVLSRTLTVCEQNELLLQESVAFQVRVAMKAPPASGFVTVPETIRVTFV